MWPLVPLLLLGLLRPCAAGALLTQCESPTDGTIYKYQAKTLNGSHTVNFSDYKGKSVLFVNVATHVRPGNGFVPNFLLFEKGDVNGKDEQEVFTFLKNSCPPVGDSFGNPINRLFWEPLKLNDIKWNFEKFLVGPDGRPVMRWHPRVNISEVRAGIRKYLLELYTQDIFD
ncbi:hypothetical protein L3Q82_005799 [Scortum barcoo]|uniref:Uncharacterized protein n=1 Tax=Scortum barcoo TaxID=214431 RepID=A0ACB8V6U5_9TELE|nr:hypothetical protein L3Q82_005799 [Scortum barcoo]